MTEIPRSLADKVAATTLLSLRKAVPRPEITETDAAAALMDMSEQPHLTTLPYSRQLTEAEGRQVFESRQMDPPAGSLSVGKSATILLWMEAMRGRGSMEPVLPTESSEAAQVIREYHEREGSPDIDTMYIPDYEMMLTNLVLRRDLNYEVSEYTPTNSSSSTKNVAEALLQGVSDVEMGNEGELPKSSPRIAAEALLQAVDDVEMDDQGEIPNARSTPDADSSSSYHVEEDEGMSDGSD